MNGTLERPPTTGPEQGPDSSATTPTPEKTLTDLPLNEGRISIDGLVDVTRTRHIGHVERTHEKNHKKATKHQRAGQRIRDYALEAVDRTASTGRDTDPQTSREHSKQQKIKRRASKAHSVKYEQQRDEWVYGAAITEESSKAVVENSGHLPSRHARRAHRRHHQRDAKAAAILGDLSKVADGSGDRKAKGYAKKNTRLEGKQDTLTHRQRHHRFNTHMGRAADMYAREAAVDAADDRLSDIAQAGDTVRHHEMLHPAVRKLGEVGVKARRGRHARKAEVRRGQLPPKPASTSTQAAQTRPQPVPAAPAPAEAQPTTPTPNTAPAQPAQAKKKAPTPSTVRTIPMPPVSTPASSETTQPAPKPKVQAPRPVKTDAEMLQGVTSIEERRAKKYAELLSDGGVARMQARFERRFQAALQAERDKVTGDPDAPVIDEGAMRDVLEAKILRDMVFMALPKGQDEVFTTGDIDTHVLDQLKARMNERSANEQSNGTTSVSTSNGATAPRAEAVPSKRPGPTTNGNGHTPASENGNGTKGSATSPEAPVAPITAKPEAQEIPDLSDTEKAWKEMNARINNPAVLDELSNAAIAAAERANDKQRAKGGTGRVRLVDANGPGLLDYYLERAVTSMTKDFALTDVERKEMKDALFDAVYSRREEVARQRRAEARQRSSASPRPRRGRAPRHDPSLAKYDSALDDVR